MPGVRPVRSSGTSIEPHQAAEPLWHLAQSGGDAADGALPAAAVAVGMRNGPTSSPAPTVAASIARPRMRRRYALRQRSEAETNAIGQYLHSLAPPC